MSKHAVITHGHCLDGFTAAYMAEETADSLVEINHWFWEHNVNPPTFRGEYEVFNDPSRTTPGRLVRFVAGEEVEVDIGINLADFDKIIFADIFPTVEMLGALVALGAKDKVVILDHHIGVKKQDTKPFPKEAQYDCALRLGFKVVFDNDHSGAHLMWEYLQEDGTADLGDGPPLLVRLIEDGDLWKFQVEGTKEFRVYMENVPKTMKNWKAVDDMLRSDPQALMAQGKALVDFRDTLVEKMCKHAVWSTFGGHDVPMVNSNHWQSEIGNRLCTMYPEAKFGLVFAVEGLKVVISLRSDNKVKVDEIALQFGGGGHENAAGCQQHLRDFIDVMSSARKVH